jgi:hypothetical protein
MASPPGLDGSGGRDHAACGDGGAGGCRDEDGDVERRGRQWTVVAATGVWALATVALTLGSSVPCRLAEWVPGGEPGPSCASGLPPGDRLDGWLVPTAGSWGDPVFWAQLVLNVAWFVPVGLWSVRRHGRRVAAVVGALLGAAIELAQLLVTRDRYPSLLDVALNASGALVGAMLGGRRPGRDRGGAGMRGARTGVG